MRQRTCLPPGVCEGKGMECLTARRRFELRRRLPVQGGREGRGRSSKYQPHEEIISKNKPMHVSRKLNYRIYKIKLTNMYVKEKEYQVTDNKIVH